jgi:hypothetical protein
MYFTKDILMKTIKDIASGKEYKVITEEYASNEFLSGNSSVYTDENIIIINHVKKANNIFKGIFFSFKNKEYFIKYSNICIWEYRGKNYSKLDESDFVPNNNLDISSLFMVHMLELFGLKVGINHKYYSQI